MMDVLSYVHTPTLVFFLTLWVGTLLRSKDKHKFDNDGFASSIHSIVVVFLASASLFFRDESIVSESMPLMFSRSYFLVDILDCIVRLDGVFTLHGILSLLLNVGCQMHPDVYAWRAGSMGYMTEISTPLYNRWKGTKSKGDFTVFCGVFFLCRIVWVPVFLWGWFRRQSPPNYDWLMATSSVFYVLQLVFFWKIVGILRNYDVPREKKKK